MSLEDPGDDFEPFALYAPEFEQDTDKLPSGEGYDLSAETGAVIEAGYTDPPDNEDTILIAEEIEEPYKGPYADSYPVDTTDGIVPIYPAKPE